MRQLTKKEILELPAGMWCVYLKLYNIINDGKPNQFMSTRWRVEVDILPPNNRYLKVFHLNWTPYNVKQDCADMGDLVYDGMLMRIFTN
jgi:hypothetical protein